MPKPKIDKGPKNLSLEARRFYVRIREEYELTSDASAILEVGLANWQMAREARALIRKEGIVMNGRRHPAIEMQKLGDAMFLRSMRELGLNISDPQDVGRPPETLAGAAIPPGLAQEELEF